MFILGSTNVSRNVYGVNRDNSDCEIAVAMIHQMDVHVNSTG